MRRTAWVLLWALALSACASEKPAAEGASGPKGIPVAFEGVKQASKRDLLAAARREIHSFRAHKRVADLEDAAYSIVQSLRAAGFAFAAVEWRREPAEGEVRRAVFVVDEGPLTFLGKVTVETQGPGADALPQEQLLAYFKFPGNGLLGSGGPLYRRSEVQGAMIEIERAFLAKGYYRVESGPLKVQWNADRTRADVRAPVTTGPLHTISVRPPEGLPEAVLQALPDWKQWDGGPYRVRIPTEISGQIRKALREHGYQLATVEPIYTAPRETTHVDLSFDVDVGPVLVLRDVPVEGTERTKPEFVRKQVRIEPGDVLKQGVLDAMMERLFATGLFRRVDLTLEPSEDDVDPRPADVRLKVKERAARTVDFDLGFGSYELLRGGVSYRDRNLFGAARSFDAALRASLRGARAEVGLTDPYTLGNDNTLLARAGAEIREQPVFSTQSIFGSLAVRHELSRSTSVTGGYRFKSQNVTSTEVEAIMEDEDTTTIDAGLFINLRHGTRDNPLIPERGVLANLGVFWSTPTLLADLDYLETSASFTHYFTLAEDKEDTLADTTVAWGARFITRHILNDDATLPIQERLFLGGESSVRSFGEAELGPFDSDRTPLGGLTAIEAHAELRQRLTGNLFGALFYDVGVVNPESYDFSGPFGHAIGVGLRYYLPVGPARLDLAYNPGETFASEDRWALHFAFGFSF